MKKILTTFTWMVGVVILVLVAAGYYQFNYLPQQPVNQPVSIVSHHEVRIAQKKEAHHQQVKGVKSNIQAVDGRAQIVASFLKRYNSPLKPYDYYGEKLVAIADRYNLDFRLLPAIAMQESNLCKKAPAGTHNCLGFGIHSRGTLGFDSYEACFERAGRELKANYIDHGLTTTREIMSKYTPHSNGSWANSVNQWMTEMEYNDRQKGIRRKKDAYVLQYAN
jgi:hypothetical protein